MRRSVSRGSDSSPCRCRSWPTGEETPNLEHCVRGKSPDASEVWLALVVVALLILALCALTAVWVTAVRTS